MKITDTTLEALGQLNDRLNGATFISIDTKTEVTLLGGQKNPLQGRVTKRMAGANCMIFQNKSSNAYENMVRRKLAGEGKDPESFELSPRAWGQRIPQTPFVEHNGKIYIEVIFLKAGDVEYLLDGQPSPRIKSKVFRHPLLQKLPKVVSKTRSSFARSHLNRSSASRLSGK